MSLSAPKKKELLAEYNYAQKCGKFALVIETLFALALLLNSNFSKLSDKLDQAIIVLGISILPTLLSLAYLVVKNKKKVQDLKPSTKYGHLTKTDIIDVCDTVCNRMAIKPGDVSFYITGEKQVNASALTLGLGYLIKSLQVVMLNRATLHALKKQELTSIVAHELAHIYRYPLIFQQALLLRLFNSAAISLSLLTLIPNIFVVAVINGLYQGFISAWFGRFSITIEFLCDDCGAEIAGAEAALKAEFLISKHAEALSDALYYLLKAKREGHNLNSKDLARLLEDSLSYDCLSSEELNAQVEGNLKNHQAKVQSNFFQYFKSQVFNDSIDTDQELEDEFKDLEKSRKQATLELPSPHELDINWFKELIARIRDNPQTPLFRTTNDLNDTGSSHPGPRRRILYLWQEFVERG